MAKIAYDVELIRQENNPICWVASCAMVKGYGTQSSVGVGDLAGGFDPSNSCIANLAGNWQQCVDAMNNWGFSVSAVSDLDNPPLTPEALLAALQNMGPAVLLHFCSGFPYGSQWASLSFKPTDAHAIVITGVDTDASTATFNNPWGDKDQSCELNALIQKAIADQQVGKTVGFWRS